VTTTEARTIENPVNGERVVVRRTASETGGTAFECDFYMRPGGGSPMSHVHAKQDEHVTVVAGTATCSVGRPERRLRLAVGQSMSLPAGTPHRVFNEAEDELHLIIEYRPALDVEGLLRTLFGLAAAGRTDKHGRPRLADRIVLARDHAVFAAGPPIALQRAFAALLAPLARRASRKDREAA